MILYWQSYIIRTFLFRPLVEDDEEDDEGELVEDKTLVMEESDDEVIMTK